MIAANVNALWPNQIKEGSLFLAIRVSFTYHHKGNDGIKPKRASIDGPRS